MNLSDSIDWSGGVTLQGVDAMDELKGKTFIVTGASMGIGRALALELARIGVNLVLNARSSSPLGEAAA